MPFHALLVCLLPLCFLLKGCGEFSSFAYAAPGDELSFPGASSADEPGEPLIDMKVGPIVQFEDACSRCHGPYGSFYGDEFAHLPHEELKEVVWDMMVGPPGLNPIEREVDAMTEYHHALREKHPFATLNNAASANISDPTEVHGDVTLDTKVILQKNDSTREAMVKGNTWKVENPPSPPFRIIAKKGEKEASFDYPARQWNQVKALH